MFKREPSEYCRTVFSLPETLRSGITDLAAIESTGVQSKSITSCFIDALEWYFALPPEEQIIQALPSCPLSHYTLRMPPGAREQLQAIANEWQLKSHKRTSMNTVLISAVSKYLSIKLPKFVSPYGK